MRLQEARIAAKQREIEAAVAARNPATSQAVLLGMRRSLSIMQVFTLSLFALCFFSHKKGKLGCFETGYDRFHSTTGR